MAASRTVNQATPLVRQALAGTPADQVLRESLVRTRHYSAPADRRAVSQAVFAYFRWWHWLDAKASLQMQIEAAMALQDRINRNLSSIKPEALKARAVPAWLATEMPDLPAAWLRQLQCEPVLWIRTRLGLETSVAAALKDCAAASDSTRHLAPSALRYTGTTDLYRTPGFQAGEFEIQDLASQCVGHACAPQPGETWWDACAGEGGKTMHLADLMQNRGMLWASDRSARRLAKLKERAARAKVFNYRTAPWEGGAKLPTRTRFDGVLIDAPCSGIGTWQRNPHARWTTQPADVRELAAIQHRLLAHAAAAVKPGGRLVYAVCTLTRSETTAVAEAFTAGQPEFEPVAFSTLASDQPALTLWPQDLNANGMFLAQWRRK